MLYLAMDGQVVAEGTVEACCELPADDLPGVLKKNCLDPSL